ncbi:hypothetical protein [Azorhizophilus paspali]|uniref:Uncharacterized protein n=1 Tax=Azorhizophilus paspali TaxID=69963 RepID=A0ABV6SHC7_AZOPA
MIANAILGSAAAVLLIAYWSFCRSAALKLQSRVVPLIEAFYADDSASEQEKDSIHWSYAASRIWIFMPLMALASPVVLAMAILSKSGGKVASEVSNRSAAHNEIMDCLIKMCIVRNPLTSMFCMYVVFAAIAILAPIGLLLDRLKSIPNPMTVYRVIAATLSSRDSRKAHAH